MKNNKKEVKAWFTTITGGVICYILSMIFLLKGCGWGESRILGLLAAILSLIPGFLGWYKSGKIFFHIEGIKEFDEKVAFLNDVVYVKSDNLSNDKYFMSFINKYYRLSDFIEKCGSDTISHKNDWNDTFIDVRTVREFTYFELFMHYLFRDPVPELSNEIDKLNQILHKQGMKITTNELKKSIVAHIFAKRLHEFKIKIGDSGDIIRTYYDINGDSYTAEDIVFLFYIMYGPHSNETFNTIISKLKLFSDNKDLENFEKFLLSDINDVTTIYDVDNMDGSSFEILVANILKKQNFEVELTKSTGDQGVDIIASNMKDRIAVQAKCYSNPVGNKAVQQVIAGAQFYDCNKSMVVTNSGFTKSAVNLALKSKVKLVDRSELKEWLDKYYS